MRVCDIQFKGEDLNRMPLEEAALFTQLGHLDNELMFLFRLQIVLTRTHAELPVGHSASSFQMLCIMRVIAGKLSEAWGMLDKDFFGTRLSQKYEPILDQAGADGLRNIKRYFSKKNLIDNIRNNFAFHYGSDELRNFLRTLPDSKELHFYMSPSRYSSLHAYAEDIVSNATVDQVRVVDGEQALGQIVDDCVSMSQSFRDFANNCTTLIFQEYLGPQFNAGLKAEIEIRQKSKLCEIKLPYFFEIDSPKQ